MSAAANLWNLTWTPPAWGELNFGADCRLFAAYAAEYMTKGSQGLPYRAAMDYMASILPRDLSPMPTPFQILEWHELMRAQGAVRGSWYTEGMPQPQFECRNLFFQNVTREAFAANESCTLELCGLLESRIDEELAGIGVLTSYVLEAILVTTYCLAFALMHYRHMRLGAAAAYGPFIERVFKAFRGSSYDLFIGTIVLNLAVQAGAYKELFAGTRGKDPTAYAQASTGLVLAFSFFPLMVLFPLITLFGRRRWLKLNILAALWVLWSLSALWFGLPQLTQMMFTDPLNYGYVQLRCTPKVDAAHVGVITFFILVALMIPPLALVSLGLWWVLDGLSFCRGWLHAPGMRRLLRRARNVVPFVVATVGLVAMWLVLWSLLRVRFGIQRQRDGRDANGLRRGQWTTGQILAVTTWAPVVAEFLYIFICGSPSSLRRNPFDVPGLSLTIVDSRSKEGSGGKTAARVYGCGDEGFVHLLARGSPRGGTDAAECEFRHRRVGDAVGKEAGRDLGAEDLELVYHLLTDSSCRHTRRDCIIFLYSFMWINSDIITQAVS
jgi:hypothetical protein